MINSFKTFNDNISIVRGDTLAFGVELYAVNEENDAVETLFDQDLDSCFFSVRKDYSNTENVFQKSLTDGITKVETGKYRVRIAPEDTAELEVGNYYYDLEIGINGDYFTVLRGLFEIEYDITKATEHPISPNARLIDFVSGNIGAVSATDLEGAEQIRDYCFYHYEGLTSISIPNSVKSIGAYAFEDCVNLTNITIPYGVTSIGNYAFNYCERLLDFTIPNSVTDIGMAAFRECITLKNITIPNGVKNINELTFASCDELTTITLPSSVTSIGGQFIAHCSALTTLIVNATTPPTLSASAFVYSGSNYVIYVPAESVDAYKTAWSAKADYIQAIPT